jgi:hypothetical protein
MLGSGRGGSTKRLEEGTVIHAVLLPNLPSPSETRTDLFGADIWYPVRSILFTLFSLVLNFPRMQTENDEECDSSFVLYSLRNHYLVK